MTAQAAPTSFRIVVASTSRFSTSATIASLAQCAASLRKLGLSESALVEQRLDGRIDRTETRRTQALRVSRAFCVPTTRQALILRDAGVRDAPFARKRAGTRRALCDVEPGNLEVLVRHGSCIAVALVMTTIASLASGARAQSRELAWEHETTEDGIALYTREVDAHAYDVVKAEATLDARPQTLLALLRDIESYPSWYHGCRKTRVLERPSELASVHLAPDGRFTPREVKESYVLFFLQHMPSISDRWAVLRNTVRIAPDGSLVIAFHSLDTHGYAAPADTVRMRLQGRWVLRPLSRERTRVSFELDIDPRTSALAMLVDPRIHETAMRTLRNLRRLAAQPRSIERGRALLTQ